MKLEIPTSSSRMEDGMQIVDLLRRGLIAEAILIARGIDIDVESGHNRQVQTDQDMVRLAK